jgi:hypothetical protein
LADSTHSDKDKAAPTPPIIAMLPFEEEQDTNTNQEQANGVECCYFVAGDKPDQLLHDGSPLIGPFSHVRFPNDTSRLKAHLLRMMNEPVTLCVGGGHPCPQFDSKEMTMTPTEWLILTTTTVAVVIVFGYWFYRLTH